MRYTRANCGVGVARYVSNGLEREMPHDFHQGNILRDVVLCPRPGVPAPPCLEDAQVIRARLGGARRGKTGRPKPGARPTPHMASHDVLRAGSPACALDSAQSAGRTAP